MSNRVAVVINERSGSNLSGGWDNLIVQLRQALIDRGEIVAVQKTSGKGLAEAIQRIVSRADIDILVMVGGDGSVSRAGADCAKMDKQLLPLPFGTFNLICRSLGMPQRPDLALQAIPKMVERSMDVGSVNGQTFLHHVSLGLHPRFIMARKANQYHSRFGKIRSSIVPAFKVLKSIRHWPARITIDGTELNRRIAGLAVTVSRIAERPGVAAIVENPSGGSLAVYLTDVRNSWHLLWLFLRFIAGGKRPGPFLDVRHGKTVSVQGRGRKLTVSIDGETVRLSLPLTIRLHRNALRIIAPEQTPLADGERFRMAADGSSAA